MCYVSPVRSTGRFMAVLWVLCKRFSLHKVYQGWGLQRRGPTDIYRENTVYIKTHKTLINRPVDLTGET